jgi:hypothetical protein
MPLTQKAIDDLKAIHRRKTGQELSDDDAWEMGNRLIRLFAVLTREPAGKQVGSGGSNCDPPPGLTGPGT